MNEKQRMEELSLSWNHGKNEQICTVKFQNFLGAMPPDPHTREGLRRPTPGPTPSALRRFAPPCLARGLRPLHRPSVCVVDILRYFRPWILSGLKMWVRGHSKLLKLVPFESLDAVSYSPSIVTRAVSVAVCETFSVKEWRDLENQVSGRSRSLKMAPFDRPYSTFYYSAHCKYSSILYHFRVFWRCIISWPWNRG